MNVSIHRAADLFCRCHYEKREAMSMESGFMHQLLQQLINGLSLGSIYALIALGYTMIYGI